LNQFNFWDAVPLGESLSTTEIAKKVGLHEVMVCRLLRHAFTRRLFTETKPSSNMIKHTSFSATMARNPLMRSWVGHNLEEMAPASQGLCDALRKYHIYSGDEEDGEPTHNPLSLTLEDNKDKDAFFDFVTNREDNYRGPGHEVGWRMKRFGEAMSWINSDPTFNIEAIDWMYPWGTLPEESTVVDVSVVLAPFSNTMALRNDGYVISSPIRIASRCLITVSMPILRIFNTGGRFCRPCLPQTSKEAQKPQIRRSRPP
jgi:hypothetical protein